MDISKDVTILHYEDTGVPGYMQICSKPSVNICAVKYFPDISQPNQYLSISIYEFIIRTHDLDIDKLTKKMIMMFLMKNAIHIYMYYYHGSTMNDDELSTLFGKIKMLTSSDVNTCIHYELDY